MKMTTQHFLALSLLLGSFQASALQTLVCGNVNSSNSVQAQQETRGTGEYTVKVDCNLDGKVEAKDPVIEIDSFATDPTAPNAKLSDASRRGWITRYKQDIVQQALNVGMRNAREHSPEICMVAEVTADPCSGNANEISITSVQKMTSSRKAAWINHFKETKDVKALLDTRAGIID